MTVNNRGVAEFLRQIVCGGMTESCLGVQRVGADPMAVFSGFPENPDDVVAQWVFGGCQFHDAARING